MIIRNIKRITEKCEGLLQLTVFANLATAAMEKPVFKTDDIALLAVIIEFWFLDGLFYYLHLI